MRSLIAKAVTGTMIAGASLAVREKEQSRMTQHTDMGGLVERLRKAAETSSRIAREMAEAKSLRNSDGEINDLYSWPEPAQTLEGQAADAIEALSIPQGLGEKK